MGTELESVFPLRVVDLATTLSDQHSRGGGVCFHKPTQWSSFHIISHTWSQGIRDLSEKIGKAVASTAAGAASSGDATHAVLEYTSEAMGSYDRAFWHANLSGEPCFKDFIGLLELLSADGVEAIWMDALCINQKDPLEKSREIARMGDYYKLSKGCYVLTHGIDQGFQLWKGPLGSLPRWFTRVWTFQEFLLPSQLFFIVCNFHPKTIAFVNQCILTWGDPDVGFCRCVLHHATSYWQKVAFADHSSGNQLSIASRTRFCKQCMMHTAIWETQNSGMSDSHVYFVEREAYLLLMKVDFEIQAPPLQGPLSFTAMGNDFEEQSTLLLLLNNKANCRPNQVVRAISVRHCSVEENRVLSILGVLNVVHMGQLRIGKTLAEQIAAMAIAKVAHGDDEQDFFIEMMAMDKASGYYSGLSWAPNFASNENRCTDILAICLQERSFERCVDVGGITKDGKLRLDGAKVARVRISVATSPNLTYASTRIDLGDKDEDGCSWYEYFVSIQFEECGSHGFKLKIDMDHGGSSLMAGGFSLPS